MASTASTTSSLEYMVFFLFFSFFSLIITCLPLDYSTKQPPPHTSNTDQPSSHFKGSNDHHNPKSLPNTSKLQWQQQHNLHNTSNISQHLAVAVSSRGINECLRPLCLEPHIGIFFKNFFLSFIEYLLFTTTRSCIWKI